MVPLVTNSAASLPVRAAILSSATRSVVSSLYCTVLYCTAAPLTQLQHSGIVPEDIVPHLGSGHRGPHRLIRPEHHTLAVCMCVLCI